MHFFKKLFGAVSGSKGKNDYALATLEYATGRRAYNTNALTCHHDRLPALKADTRYDPAISDYAMALEIDAMKALNPVNPNGPGSKKNWQRIIISSYRAYSHNTDLLIHRS
ncbi:MAG: hypothetical protein JW837_14635 [Sedimentisphaerales bacterium]|nr:hypothetical protein [Sedimentisphaerales bacterium]